MSATRLPAPAAEPFATGWIDNQGGPACILQAARPGSVFGLRPITHSPAGLPGTCRFCQDRSRNGSEPGSQGMGDDVAIPTPPWVERPSLDFEMTRPASELAASLPPDALAAGH